MNKNIIVTGLCLLTILTSGAGYMGTLPDVESEFSYLRKEVSEKSVVPYSVEELDKMNEDKLKPIPRNNDDYVDIIIRKDNSSEYLKDVNHVIMILEKLRKCINTDQDIQKFNAIVSNLMDNVEYIKKEYYGKPEQNYLSYNRLIYISQEASSVASYRIKELTFKKYIPTNSEGNIYTKENYDMKMENLLNNVNETIFILKNLE